MKYEVEQKFRVADLAPVEERLRRLGATIEEAIEQTDCYFAHPCRDFAVTDEALRIRRAGGANFITYKGPKIDAQTKTRREIEMAMPAGEASWRKLRELLIAIGFSPVANVVKRRRVASVPWRGGSVEAALDEVKQLGCYVELELGAEESGVAEARSRIAALADRLELTDNERRSYLELLLERPEEKMNDETSDGQGTARRE